MPKKVFIVEDNELNLKLFRDLLQSEGCQVIATSDGNEAFGIAERERPDLILMDIQLHGISGFDIIKLLKQHDDLKVIPVIAVTAFAMKDDEAKILESGCDAYIAKPISIAPFLTTVRDFLTQRQSVISEEAG